MSTNSNSNPGADTSPYDTPPEELESVQRMTRDMSNAGATLDRQEARFLVDTYYQMQDNRIRATAQLRAMLDQNEPHSVVRWQADNMAILENTIKNQLGKWVGGQEPGRWAMSITGIGPVIAAGMLANIDIEKAPTVGHIWRFAGLDPTVTWGKGEKRPWNARLKVLCWKAGESFVKVQNRESDIYGKVYATRKAEETAKNEARMFADQAAMALATKKYSHDTEAYKAYIDGRLPLARIHLRSTRYAVKLFLSHLHHVMYESHYRTAPPKPYIIEHGGHVHFIAPPNWPMEE